MGFFSDLMAISEVKKLKKPSYIAHLSIAQITNLLINLPDASKKLPMHQYEAIKALYNKLRTCNTKIALNQKQYFEVAIDIIKRFDQIAPYEKYSGGNETEYSFLMNEVRSTEESVQDIDVDLIGFMQQAAADKGMLPRGTMELVSGIFDAIFECGTYYYQYADKAILALPVYERMHMICSTAIDYGAFLYANFGPRGPLKGKRADMAFVCEMAEKVLAWSGNDTQNLRSKSFRACYSAEVIDEILSVWLNLLDQYIEKASSLRSKEAFENLLHKAVAMFLLMGTLLEGEAHSRMSEKNN